MPQNGIDRDTKRGLRKLGWTSLYNDRAERPEPPDEEDVFFIDDEDAEKFPGVVPLYRYE